MHPLASRLVLRYSWALMFLWFGVEQLLAPTKWITYLPELTGYFPIPGIMFVRLNGWMEIVLAFALMLGIYTRFSALLLAIHLAGIAVTSGGAIGVRDATLATVGLAIAFDKPDPWTLDAKLDSKNT